MRIQLTKRDLELIEWINGFGFVCIEQISKKMGVALQTAYGRVRKLVANNYIVHERIFHGQPGIYRISTLGCQVCGDSLVPLRQVSLSTYRHDLYVVNVSLVLEEEHGGHFLTERRIRQEKGIPQVGQRGHIPDGVLTLDDKRVAIEMELSSKGKRRRQKIYDHYVKNFDYKEVWYYCGNEEVYRQMRPFAEKGDLIKLFMLDDRIESDRAA